MSVLSFKLEGSIIYTLLKLIFKVTLRLFLGYKVYGAENIPPQKGLILASNHASFLDIPSLVCGTSRRIYFVGRSNLFPIPGLRKVIEWYTVHFPRIGNGLVAIVRFSSNKAILMYIQMIRNSQRIPNFNLYKFGTRIVGTNTQMMENLWNN